MRSAHPTRDRKKETICFTLWFRQHNNPRYAALFPYLEPLVEFRKVTLSDRRVMRGLQFRAWKALRRRVTYPVAARYFAGRYPTVLTVDTHQIPAWPENQKVVVDMDDPVFTPAEFQTLKLPQVKAVVVTTRQARDIYRQHGIRCSIHVIPQGVSVDQIDEKRVAEIRAHFKEVQDVVVGYHAPTLTLASDGPRRARGGQDDLDLLLAALEEARHVEPRIKLWLLGEASESVKKCAVEHSGWIKLFGYIALSDILNYVSNFDIGVYPRTWVQPRGRFNVKLAQFMACGIPVVSTDLDESAILKETGCGIVCPSGAEFSKALVELARSAERRAELGAAGRAYARAQLDWSVLVPKYRDVLDGVIHGS